ncbi:hypothetical protein GE061_000284 [Apolygus lucorum]|uniref:Uncharacterized protein n=1 Tax=Apolygus lucorum TaxID=248454 RepID=A0A8S9Y3X9_APOLU|nr:hypothetical protein GE061_000284 [Apolygus lucorum]
MSGQSLLQSGTTGSEAYSPGEAGDLLPELNGADLAMSLSPKHQHTTPFSVTDILSPIEETYRKLELSPYRSGGSGCSTGTVPSPPQHHPYMHHVHHQFPPSAAAQYCNSSAAVDIHQYGNTPASWYGASPSDPRFATDMEASHSLCTGLPTSSNQLNIQQLLFACPPRYFYHKSFDIDINSINNHDYFKNRPEKQCLGSPK